MNYQKGQSLIFVSYSGAVIVEVDTHQGHWLTYKINGSEYDLCLCSTCTAIMFITFVPNNKFFRQLYGLEDEI